MKEKERVLGRGEMKGKGGRAGGGRARERVVVIQHK